MARAVVKPARAADAPVGVAAWPRAHRASGLGAIGSMRRRAGRVLAPNRGVLAARDSRPFAMERAVGHGGRPRGGVLVAVLMLLRTAPPDGRPGWKLACVLAATSLSRPRRR